MSVFCQLQLLQQASAGGNLGTVSGGLGNLGGAAGGGNGNVAFVIFAQKKHCFQKYFDLWRLSF